jgi:hypothetical protein
VRNQQSQSFERAEFNRFWRGFQCASVKNDFSKLNCIAEIAGDARANQFGMTRK